MAKAKTKAKSKGSKKGKSYEDVNFKKASIQRLCRHFLYGEGKMSEQKIKELVGVKDFYKLKALKYINPTGNSKKGIFKTTESLREKIKLFVDSKAIFKMGSTSSTHSQGVQDFLNLVPDSCIMSGRVKNEAQNQIDFDNFKQTALGKQRIRDLKQSIRNDKTNLNSKYQKAMDSLNSKLEDAKKVNNEAVIKNTNGEIDKVTGDYQEQFEKLQYQLDLLYKSRGMSVADNSFSFTRDEGEEVLHKLEVERDRHSEYRDQYDEAIKALREAINHAEEHDQEYVDVLVDIVTPQYKESAKLSHMNNAKALNKRLLLIPARKR